jgi:hypothetical protein
MKQLLAVSLFVLSCAVVAGPALADQPIDRNPDKPGLGWGGNKQGGSAGAPGPIAGAGLASLAAAGVFYAIRRRRSDQG